MTFVIFQRVDGLLNLSVVIKKMSHLTKGNLFDNKSVLERS